MLEVVSFLNYLTAIVQLCNCSLLKNKLVLRKPIEEKWSSEHQLGDFVVACNCNGWRFRIQGKLFLNGIYFFIVTNFGNGSIHKQHENSFVFIIPSLHI
jgi:hypothetical protein